MLVKESCITSWCVHARQLSERLLRVLYRIRLWNASCYNKRVNARMPILPIKINSQTRGRVIYARLDTGSEESIISHDLYNEINLQGEPCKCILVKANNQRSVLNTVNASFKVGTLDSAKTFLIESALVL